MNTNKSARSRFIRRQRRRANTDQLAAQLAPLEEQDKPAAEQQVGGQVEAGSFQDRDFGAIIVDSEELKIPTDITGTQEKKQFLGVEPVVLVVLIILLSFIGFITWQISGMPPK